MNGDRLEDRSENEEDPKEDQMWMMTRLLASVLQHSSVLHPVPILFYVGTSIIFFISSLVIVVTELLQLASETFELEISLRVVCPHNCTH